MSEFDCIYHSERVSEEMERARGAAKPEAAAAHFRLAELHLDRLADAANRVPPRQ